MPSHHVVGTVILNSLEEMTAVFVDHSVLDIQIFEPGARRLKIPGIGQPVCTWLLLRRISRILTNKTGGICYR